MFPGHIYSCGCDAAENQTETNRPLVVLATDSQHPLAPSPSSPERDVPTINYGFLHMPGSVLGLSL